MTRLSPTTYLDHLRTESARFREVLTDCDPAARVPACPDWDAADLVWHLAEVQAFWTGVLRTRPAPASDNGIEPPARPDSYAGLLGFFDEASATLADQLATADADENAWSWAGHVSDGQTVGFTHRRQAHEALIHRVDAEQTAGLEPARLDPALAADGVAELMEVMYGGEAPPWARFEPGPGPVCLELTDVGQEIWVSPGWLRATDPESGTVNDGPHLLVLDRPGDRASAVARGAAADLDLWLWNRSPQVPAVAGDEKAYACFRAAVGEPLT